MSENYTALGFTVRDVDPLGRGVGGDATQREAGAVGERWDQDHAEHIRDNQRPQWCEQCDGAPNNADDALRSDLRKCDENTLRS